MVVHWSEDHVEFFDITHDGKHWHIWLIQHCDCCDGQVWAIDDDPTEVEDHPARFRTHEGAIEYIKEELRAAA